MDFHPMQGSSRYNALSWAASRSRAEIEAHVAYLEENWRTPAGSATDHYTWIDTLKDLLNGIVTYSPDWWANLRAERNLPLYP